MYKLLGEHDCTTPVRHGWGGIQNGELLRHAESAFDLFITSDQNLRYQQNLAIRRIAIIQLSTNKLRRIISAASLISSAVASIKPGDFLDLQIP